MGGLLPIRPAAILRRFGQRKGQRICYDDLDRRDIGRPPCQTKNQGGRIDMTKVAAVHKQRIGQSAYRKAHAASEGEFTLARELIGARVSAGLTQEQLAQRMGTTQSAIARLETGRRVPGVRTLEPLAEATGTRLVVRFG